MPYVFKQLSAMALLCALVSTSALAQSDTVSAAQKFVVNVHGIVCEFCSYGVAKKIRKLSFVDKSIYDKGVKVNIENQMVFVAVKKGASLDQAKLYKAIESGGYKPVKIWSINAAGEKTELE